jgi:hypothetical protein
MCAARGILKQRAQPAEEKSQRDAERHFRFSACAITKSDRNFLYAQRATAAYNRFENNFKTAGVWR